MNNKADIAQIKLVILTNNRVAAVEKLIKLYKQTGFQSISIFDSGNHPELQKIAQDQCIEYYQNNAKNGLDNLYFALTEKGGDVLVLHDDDFIKINQLKATLTEYKKYPIIISPENQISGDILTVPEALKLYFLNKNKAPLISGIIIKDSGVALLKTLLEKDSYKYMDVEVITKLLHHQQAVVTNKPFIEYTSDNISDNSHRSIDDRILLYEYLLELSNDYSVAKTIAPLVFYKYPNKIVTYTFGLINLVRHPEILRLYTIKFINRIISKIEPKIYEFYNGKS